MIDTHAHLMYSHRGGYAGGPDGVVERAIAAGVEHILCVGAGGDLAEVESALWAARRFPGVSAICGIHPHDAHRLFADGAQELWAGVERACSEPICLAVGETGLDYHYDLSDRSQQRSVFAQHIDLARRLKKPLCIHTRNAEEETFELLKDCAASDVGGVIHCFSGSAEFGLRCAHELGFYLSIPGIVTFKQPGELHELIRQAPRERLLIETDSPFLAPVPQRGKTNEPAHLGHTLAKLSELLGLSLAEAAMLTSANARRLFGARLDLRLQQPSQ